MLECQVQITAKAFVYAVTKKPNKTTYAQFCYTDFDLRDSRVNITFKFFTYDQSHDVVFEQSLIINNPDFDNFVLVLKSKM